MKKKWISLLAAAAMVAAMGATPVYAHCRGGGRISAAAYAVCDIEDCTLARLHVHDDVYYYAHYDGDGHTYHGICDIADCTLAGYHEHDGEYCFGGYAGYGCGYQGGRYR